MMNPYTKAYYEGKAALMEVTGPSVQTQFAKLDER